MDRLDLVGMFMHFLLLWFMAVGGPSTILPEIHRYFVEAHGLLTSAQFAEIYTLAQAAPGPNVMYVTLIGWYVAGWAGAAATTIPLLVPATTLTLLVGHLNERYPNAPIGRALRRGLTPITVGLMFAGATILIRAVNHDWRGYLISLLTVAVVLRKTWNPLWLLAGWRSGGNGWAGLITRDDLTLQPHFSRSSFSICAVICRSSGSTALSNTATG